MTEQEAMATATIAAEAWGGLAETPRVVSMRENVVLDVRLSSGKRAALRLHRPGYVTADEIRAELLWCERLADTGFACPWPERTQNNDFVYKPPDGERNVSIVHWIAGNRIGAAETPYDDTEQAQRDLYRRLGALLADLHLTSDDVAPADLSRPAWLAPAFCSDTPQWGRFWENPALSDEDAAVLVRARDAAKECLADIPETQTGLIHADVMQENVIEADDTLFLIDFDDSGYGYRMYDLATALVQHQWTPMYGDLSEALLEGYVTDDGPLPVSAFAELDLFVMLRTLASAGWIMSRAEPQDPRHAYYAERAVKAASGFLNS